MKYEKYQVKLLIIKLLTQSFKVYENLECDENLSNNLFLIFISLFLHFCLSFLPLYTHTHTHTQLWEDWGREDGGGRDRKLFNNQQNTFQSTGVLLTVYYIIWKDPNAEKDWGWEEKGKTKDEIVGWHHRLSGHEFEQTLEDDEGQGSLACCSPWGGKKLDMI